MDETKETQLTSITDRVSLRSLTTEMRTNYINYAMSVIVARALPDVRDGLKPVQRRIIYSMYKLGIIPSGGYKKSARTVGDVIAKYHPHGDVAVYDALVRMAQDFNLRYLLIDGQGNFGSIDGDSPAAMRYTEAKLQKITLEITNGLRNNTVDYVDNYDGNTKEPKIMPAAIPVLLMNGADGIAVGMATKIPPHNLRELIGAIKLSLANGGAKYDSEDPHAYAANIRTESDLAVLSAQRFPKFSTETEIAEMLKIMPGPDFPTGGEMYDTKAISEIYTTGKGRVLMRAIAKIEELKGGRFQIVVTEIPYQVNKARLVAKMADLVKETRITGISDIRDESNRTGMRVVIEIKRDGKPKTILNKLFKFTEMQKAFNAHILTLVNGEPRTINLKEYVEFFITHRQQIVIREHEYELAKAREREHILEGLMIALDNLDEVISIIRSSKDAETAKINLITRFKLSEIQAQAILDMQLRRLAALERAKIEEEYKNIQARISEILDILTKPERVLSIIEQQLTNIDHLFGDKRRTKVFKGKLGEISDEDLIAEEEMVITVSEKGYIKRIKSDVYQLQNRGGIGKKGMSTRDDDNVSHIFICNTHDDILFFTNKGRVFIQKVYEIPEYGRSAKGQAIVNLINIDQNELITSILTKSKQGTILDEETIQENEAKSEKKPEYKYLFMATAKGTVKKSSLEDFNNIRSNGLIAIKLDEDDQLAWVKPTHGTDEIILVTSGGRSIRFSETDVRETGRASMGVRGIKLKSPQDYVIAADVVRKKEVFLFTISAKGFGKVTKISQFTKQGRGGQGIFASRVNEKTGNLVAARLLDHPHMELLMMSAQGLAVKIKTDDLPERNRQTSGVRLIRIKNTDNVAAIAII